MPTSPCGVTRIKKTKIKPKYSNQLSVNIDRYSRNRMKNNAPKIGPEKLRIPPIKAIASNSPENANDMVSAEAIR